MRLYEIADEYLDACDKLFSIEDIPENVMQDTLDSLNGDIIAKSLNIAAYCKNTQAEIDAMKSYEKSMKLRRQAAENKLTRLKMYLLENLKRCNLRNVKGTELSISLRENQPSVIIDDIDSIDEKFILYFEAHPDKKKIKCYLQDGNVLEGAHLEASESLIISK